VEQAEAHVASQAPPQEYFDGLLFERHGNVVKPAAKAQAPPDADFFGARFQHPFDARPPARDLLGRAECAPHRGSGRRDDRGHRQRDQACPT
jgi:hypothetical protein